MCFLELNQAEDKTERERDDFHLMRPILTNVGELLYFMFSKALSDQGLLLVSYSLKVGSWIGFCQCNADLFIEVSAEYSFFT